MTTSKTVGYAVVGLGAISQVAVLPAFKHTRRARLVALVSGDKDKAQGLARKFRALGHYEYPDYVACLGRSDVDAVYIATPPGAHESYAVRAAQAGKHVLCEKPLAATVAEGKRMVRACDSHRVRLMTAYRKYFEPASVTLKDIVQGGELGRVDIIHTLFTEFRPSGDNSPGWLFSRKLGGGGPLMDLGVYCVNTSRWLSDEDPVRASAVSWVHDHKRFREVEEGVAFRLDFPSGAVVQGTTTYGSVLTSFLNVHGEKGWASLCPAYAFEQPRRLLVDCSQRRFEKSFGRLDEFALELDAFSESIRKGVDPEPNGYEGLKDLVIIEAIYRSARTSRPVPIHYPRRSGI
jgi:predicted dehydrogenase